MTAVNQGSVLKLPGYTAAADLTTHQYKFVEIVAGTRTVNVANATTDKPIGVLVNKPKAGEAVEVVIVGIVEVVAGETLAEGDQITTSATGLALNDVPGAAPLMWFGRVLSGGALNELVTAAVNCVF